MNLKNPAETRTIEKSVDLLDRIIEETRDVGISASQASGVEYTSFTGLCTLAKLIFEAGACPKSMDSSKKVLIAIAQGQTVGLNAFQSMQAFYIVNGQATLWGNAPLAICRQHPAWSEEGFDEWFEVAGKRIDGHPQKWDDDSITAVCQTQREIAQPKKSHFSVADAKKAGLWGQTGKLYGSYPFRMLKARARGYALNDNFGDSLKGIQIRETFDEEVNGKPAVSNVDELREEIDKRKKEKPVRDICLADRAKQLDQDLSVLDQARDWLKTVYENIPVKMNAIECLKQASLKDGNWISLENVDNINDIDRLNQISGRLEEMLNSSKKPEFSW